MVYDTDDADDTGVTSDGAKKDSPFCVRPGPPQQASVIMATAQAGHPPIKEERDTEVGLFSLNLRQHLDEPVLTDMQTVEQFSWTPLEIKINSTKQAWIVTHDIYDTRHN